MAVLIVAAIDDAQSAGRVWRIAYLAVGSPSSDAARIDEFRKGLRDLGYIEGKNLTIEYRFAEGQYERLAELAAELVKLKPDLIFTHTSPGAAAARNATKTIPIVFGAVGDAERRGFVDSLARPSANMTGLTLLGVDLDGKRLEILKETLPTISRVGVLINDANPAFRRHVRGLRNVSEALDLRLTGIRVQDPGQLGSALSRVAIDALLVTNDALLHDFRRRIAELAAADHIPTIAEIKEFAEDGGLIAYGPDLFSMFRYAAIYVDKILKGARPADLPVQRPTKFELVINLKTAKQIGLNIPPNVLARADKVIR